MNGSALGDGPAVEGKGRAHALVWTPHRCKEHPYESPRFHLIQSSRIMPLNHFLCGRTDMRQHKYSHRAAFQSGRALQQRLVFRCDAGDETV